MWLLQTCRCGIYQSQCILSSRQELSSRECFHPFVLLILLVILLLFHSCRIYFWGVVLGLEKIRWKTVLILLVIIGGILMGTIQPTQMHVVEFIVVLISTLLSGLRWGLTQFLAQADEQFNDTIICLYSFAHWSAIFIVPVAAVMEFPVFSSEFVTDPALFAEFWGLILFAGSVSFFLIFAEVMLVQITSSLSLGVLGQLKEILQVTQTTNSIFSFDILCSLDFSAFRLLWPW